MPNLATTSLSADERALLERFAAQLSDRLGPSLHAVWLFGSRARGEAPSHNDSDVDLLVLVDDDSWEGKRPVHEAFDEATHDLGLERLSFSFVVHIHTPKWLEGRRAIKSFFIAEVDRDKVVIAGSA
jgi:predicted nucleotidyltransferase